MERRRHTQLGERGDIWAWVVPGRFEVHHVVWWFDVNSPWEFQELSRGFFFFFLNFPSPSVSSPPCFCWISLYLPVYGERIFGEFVTMRVSVGVRVREHICFFFFLWLCISCFLLFVCYMCVCNCLCLRERAVCEREGISVCEREGISAPRCILLVIFLLCFCCNNVCCFLFCF